MSFDLAVWYEPSTVTREEAAATYERLCHGEDAGLVEHPSLATFYVDLVSEFPPSAGLPRVWSAPPEVEDNSLLLRLTQATADEVAPAIRRLAERHGLVSYDPYLGHVQLPRPLASPLLLLSGDELTSVIEPSTEELTRVVALLGKDHEYLTLQRFSQQYVQAALRTTTGRFAVEYRDSAAEQHFQCNTADLAVVEDVFLGFSLDTEDWKRQYRWRRLVLG
jgi:hypothetical protein